MDDRDAVPDRRVVQQVAGREVVGAVDDDFPVLAEDAVDVFGAQPLAVGDDLDVGVQPASGALAPRLDLRLAQLRGRMEHLALEVRLVDDVVVDDPEPPDPGRRQVERGGRAQPAGADQSTLASSSRC